jgi:hypothetical protein
MMVLSTTCGWAHTNMRPGLPCRSHIVAGLGNLNMLIHRADDRLLTSDFLFAGHVP